MSQRRYDRYKDSGVEWLGEVPAHWAVVPLKRDLSFLTSGSRGWAENYSDEGELFLRIGNLTRSGIHLDLADIQRVAVLEGTEGARTKVQSGDVLFSITAFLGSVAVVPDDLEPAYVSQHVALARPQQKKLLPRWIGYVTLSYVGKTYLETQGYGGIKIQLSLDDVANLVMTAPPLAEQQAIVTFLDHETAKIDALVAEQQRLIILLTEKRQAVISHAVTKGLDPDVEMRDSGVEWLGEVPAHWAVSPMKHHWSVTDCKHITADFIEDGLPLASIREVQSWYVDLANAKQTTHEFYYQLVEGGRTPEPGDLIFSRNATVGEVAQVSQDHPPFAMGQDVCILKRRDRKTSPDFLQHVIRSPIVGVQLAHIMIGSTFKRVNVDDIRSLMIPMPPALEQVRIGEFLSTAVAQFDRLADEADRAIALLQERRTALISAAVTGKIDVRERMPAEVS